jgi:hypothetical protein
MFLAFKSTKNTRRTPPGGGWKTGIVENNLVQEPADRNYQKNVEKWI